MTPARARTIDDVIADIDEVVRWSLDRGSRIGYFAALYRHVAVAFKKAVSENAFRDNARMQSLDCVFFNRYLVAWGDRDGGRRPTRAWQVAFEAADDDRPITVQHLLLGMNAHINLDLGVAVAHAVPEADLPRFRADFDKMNALLASLLDTVTRDLSRIWPALGVFSRVFGREESTIINFSMRAARAQAWKNAIELAALHGDARKARIVTMDDCVQGLGRLLWRPGLLPELALRLVAMSERGDVRTRIRALLASGERAIRKATLAAAAT